jgi:nicotinamidase-related amidase
MDFSRGVLVVVDMQNGFVSDKSTHIVEPVAQLAKRWMDAGRAAVFTRFINEPGSPFERLIGWTRMRSAPETDLVAVIAALADRGLAVLDKPGYSLFTTEGAGLVTQYGWTDIVIAGIATESCVLKTAVDAFERDLTPWVVRDAVYSHAGAEAHEAGLLVAGRFIGRRQLIEADELIT